MASETLSRADGRSRTWRRFKKVAQRLVRRSYDFMGRQSLIGDQPIFDPSQFSYVPVLEDNWAVIRKELDAVLAEREKIPPFHVVSPDQYKISHGENWRTFALLGFGARVEHNCARCPETMRVLEAIPGLQSAFFSILAPGFHIREHRGVTKGIIRVHLGVKVPKAADQCYMRIDDQRFHWEEGKVVVFDDTFRHEVFNNTEEERVVLFLDVDRPMRWVGRTLHRGFVALIRRTAYYKDPMRNLAKWEERFRLES